MSSGTTDYEAELRDLSKMIGYQLQPGVCRMLAEAADDLAALRKENERLREALEWYAGDGSTYDGIDVGQRARAALAATGERAIGYEKILRAYVNHIGNMEGIDFLYADGLRELTPAENITLLTIAMEGATEEYQARCRATIAKLEKEL